ncbi:glycosyltransferase [Paludibaculum fermentans]|uniref:glycosyltransferase n=1 Tax=Paludibaculum fermentans TaxID=1473598 RepID=UPI003EB7B2A2
MNAHQKNSPLRILCISPLFAPAVSAEAFCASKLVQCLNDNGVSITVLSSSNLWATETDASPLWQSLRSMTIDVPQLLQANRMSSIKSAIRFQTIGYARWISAAIERVKQLHVLNRFDLVYSRSLPSSAHIVGFWCTRQMNLPWIANINDPWEKSFNPPPLATASSSALGRHSHLFWLRRTLRKADVITYPCHRLHQFHRALAHVDHPAEIIPHIGYVAKRTEQSDEDEFRIVHAGDINGDSGRSLKTLLLGLKEFLRSVPEARLHTKLVIVGRKQSTNEELIRAMDLVQYIRHVGQVSYEESLRHIAGASVCVLIEAPVEEGIFFPSKLADYSAARKPVLAFSPARGFLADLAGSGDVIRVGYDAAATHTALAMLYQHYKSGTLRTCSPSADFANQLRGDCVTTKFLDVCNAVIARRRVDVRVANITSRIC